MSLEPLLPLVDVMISVENEPHLQLNGSPRVTPTDPSADNAVTQIFTSPVKLSHSQGEGEWGQQKMSPNCFQYRIAPSEQTHDGAVEADEESEIAKLLPKIIYPPDMTW
jgi:hypothetical protein